MTESVDTGGSAPTVANAASLSPAEKDAPISLKDVKETLPAAAPSPPTTEPDQADGEDQMEPATSDAPAKDDSPVGNKDKDTAVASVTTNPAPDEKQAATTESKFVPIVPNELSADNGASVQPEILKEQLPEATDPDEGADAAREALMSGALPQVTVEDVPETEGIQEAEKPPPSAIESGPKAAKDIQEAVKPSEPMVQEPMVQDEPEVPENIQETPSSSEPATNKTGNKRKADDIETDETTTNAKMAAAGKKVKKNDGTAVAVEQKKSRSAKPKRPAAAVGQTARKTRSQGPV